MAETTFPKTLVIIPALNERESIAGVIGNIRQQVPWVDILVVNDGSSDDTAAVAESAGAYVLHMPYNVGIGASVQTGFMFADLQGYEMVVRNDGDGQHEPHDIPTMMRALRETGADVVIGSRYLEDRGYSGTPMRRLGSII
ncbi:MAG: glycosyltransferase family 2 protein, partial [Anaerolineae bacterium]|nr:glycosyltransferase family 2 protein [Anaerolineae bacterium]